MRLLFNSKGYVINRISPEAEALKSENTSLKRRNSKLERLATVDGLTGLFNRRYFDESTYQTVLSMDRRYLQKPVEKDKRKNQSETDRRKNRSKKSLGILMLDIDNFKKINDTYGHPIGDKILRETAHILVRDSGISAYGKQKKSRDIR
ncbi:GGDEF domain-containing protein [Candidatus Woesearchaeota archaeon]|nr:GGDEF domain-containing protein [Candidatus Woesearchaeota archaeon]